MTKRELYARGLAAAGYEQVETSSEKFLCFHKQGNYLWLGKSGSVRLSKLKRIDDSIPVTDKTKAIIMRWATEGSTTQAQEIRKATQT